MIELIKTKIGNENITGIIPINPKGLKIKFANISYATGFVNWIIYFLISLFPAAFFAFLIGGMIFTVDTAPNRILALIALLIGILMFLFDYIYVNNIKKYPKTFLVIANSDLYFFAIRNNTFEIAHKFGIDINNIEKYFFGEINKKTNKIGEAFEIRQNSKTLLVGKILIKNNLLDSKDIAKEFLFPFETLKKIYLS